MNNIMNHMALSVIIKRRKIGTNRDQKFYIHQSSHTVHLYIIHIGRVHLSHPDTAKRTAIRCTRYAEFHFRALLRHHGRCPADDPVQHHQFVSTPKISKNPSTASHLLVFGFSFF